MADIPLTDLTTGTLTGDGVFDKLMVSITAQLESQFQKGRVTGADYATVYLGSMQSAMQTAAQFLLGKQQADKQADLLAQKIITEEGQVTDVAAGTLGKQQILLTAQSDGFARDAEQKVLKIMADSYAVRRSTDSGAAPPTGMEDPDITAVAVKAAEGIGVTLP